MNCCCPYCTAPFDHDVWGPEDEVEKLEEKNQQLEEENQHFRLTLMRIRDLPWGESDDITAAQEIAREALE